MAKPFRSLWDKMSPEAQAAAEQQMQALLAALPLQELQEARHRAQEHLTTSGQGTPASLAHLEHQTDLYISLLRRFIEAMGGALEITATFPEGVVQITQFHALAAAETDASP
jgi:hypothetical protein